MTTAAAVLSHLHHDRRMSQSFFVRHLIVVSATPNSNKLTNPLSIETTRHSSSNLFLQNSASIVVKYLQWVLEYEEFLVTCGNGQLK